MVRCLIIPALGLTLLAATSAVSAEKSKLPLVFKDSFEKGADHWKPTDPKAWKILETDRGKVYSQFQSSKFKPPHRSPLNISLLKDVVVGDFVLTVRAPVFVCSVALVSRNCVASRPPSAPAFRA